jgi:tripartite-type tricarboxylate transporter receptor subunit TctC
MFRPLALALSLFVAGSAMAQDYPAAKPITMIVPFSAGGPADIIARLLARVMGPHLGGTIIIENAVGAGGTLGMNRVAKAQPDGYTLLLMHTGHATAPSFYSKLPFDPIKDFQPIGMVTDVPMTIVGRKDYPARDLKELVADLKARATRPTTPMSAWVRPRISAASC